MHQDFILEVIACSVEDAIEAARGGADRLEVARDMHRQGLTPPADLVERIRLAVPLPLRVMVREHDDFLCDRPGELERLCERARELERLDVDGIVLGFARDGIVDEPPLAAVLAAAPRTRATFHRAFDALRDPLEGLRALERHAQVDRVLSGGGDGDWRARAVRLSDWAAHVHPRIVMLPGGGVDGGALEEIVRTRRLTEAHVGSAAREPATPTAPVSAAAVRALREAIARVQDEGS